MTLFQLILLISAGTIFYLFFKQLFGGSYPRRGVDFEGIAPDDHIGGLMQADKLFEKPVKTPGRIQELMGMGDEAAQQGNWAEVKKAMESALILDENNLDVLRRLGVAQLQMEENAEAQNTFEKILTIDPDDDLAEDSLGNALHKLGEDEAAMVHHKRAISLDGDYAPHYYNYANTLLDMGRKDDALVQYREAFQRDPQLNEAQTMIEELEK